MYVAGAPENQRDFLLSRIRDKKARNSLIVPLSLAAGSGKELAGEFNIVLGDGLSTRRTPFCLSLGPSCSIVS